MLSVMRDVSPPDLQLGGYSRALVAAARDAPARPRCRAPPVPRWPPGQSVHAPGCPDRCLWELS